MGLKAVVQSLDDVGEIYHDLYTESDDGKFYLDAEGVDDLPAIQGLKSTLEKFKKVDPDANRLQRRMNELAELEAFKGMDPEEVQQKLERLEELETAGDDEEKDSELKAIYERREEKRLEKHQEEIGAKDAEIERRDGFIERLLIDNRLDEALAKVKSLEEARPAAKALIKERYKPKVVEEGEDYHAIVSTDMGDEDIETFVESWSRTEEAGFAMPASGNEGSGAQSGGGGGGGRTNPWKKESWNLTEQGRIQKENPALAKSLKAAAGK